MRILMVLPVLLTAACTAQQPDNAAMPANVAAPAIVGERVAEPANSASAVEARKLAEHYFDLIGQKKYADARKLWGNDGADSGGDDAAFAATFTPYSVYRPKVGAPTEVRASGGMQYVNVAATLHVERADNQATADRNGVVMLRRSTDPNDKVADKRDWKIWGVDIRVRN